MVADLLDPEQVARVVAEAEPDVIIHQLTALNRAFDVKHFDATFEETNRLRTEGTDHLLAAGRAVGVKRFIAQSYAGWPFARTGGPVKTEDDPLDPAPPEAMRASLRRDPPCRGCGDGRRLDRGDRAPVRRLLRPRHLAQPRGRRAARADPQRKFPVVGDGGGVWSFVHIEDAAEATVAALDARPPRASTTSSTTIPRRWRSGCQRRRSAVGAPAPRHVPRWLGRIAAGEAGVVMMTEVRGASNEKAKRELGWEPRHASWREGFAEVAA